MTNAQQIKAALSTRLDWICSFCHNSDASARKPEIANLVSDALMRVENETYGLCGVCEQRISPRRLAAMPWVKYCFACQEIKDRRIDELRWDNAA